MTTGLPSRKDVIKMLADPQFGFSIQPMPTEDLIQYGSIDLRVGTVFLSAERSSLASVRAEDPWQGAKLFREVRVARGQPFVMQPHQFVLATTFEYIAMPPTLVGLIQSRSTYGRMGIIAATAAYVGPGYKGCPTLELVNLGEVAIELKPYQAICQLVLFTAAEDVIVPSRYQCSTRPSFARRPLSGSGADPN
jgi:dCTP deaminase